MGKRWFEVVRVGVGGRIFVLGDCTVGIEYGWGIYGFRLRVRS